jgi:hypothetical protein
VEALVVALNVGEGPARIEVPRATTATRGHDTSLAELFTTGPSATIGQTPEAVVLDLAPRSGVVLGASGSRA